MTFFFHYLTNNQISRKRRRKCFNQKPQYAANCTSIEDLPSHILIDILSRLPLKAILISRCVCKTWNLLISDPLFNNNNTRSNAELFLGNDHSTSISRTLHWVDLDCMSATPTPTPTNYYTNLRFYLPESCSKYEIVNSCNGFLCLSKSIFKNPSIICNPVTGEYISIPQPKDDKNVTNNVVSGFGYSFKTNQYKVLRLVLNNFFLRMAELYTLGTTTSWRKLGCAPLAPIGGLFPTYLNGVIHWACDDMDTSHFIVGFDFEQECFCVVPAPCHFDEKQKKKENMYHMNMGVLGGCLSICDVPYSTHFDIWVMKEYGVQQSWTKQFAIDNCLLCRPIKLVANGDVLLMFYKRQGLVLYDPIKKNIRYLQICDPHSIIFQAITFAPTFVSLRDAVGIDGLEVQNGRSRFAECEKDETLFLVERSAPEVY
ncbi:hypothetical protein JRO89_XSUnG0084900 [Xanthoceras sorbifolium]|uniref:F-box domain-containing protein n=1 Tax=Xanthoceras sorbifolium TaxID=99658 RepID=A0ABQ8GZJ6_9ROSI|nr:hypothetical protein JRO89_XSUnG0084900 [Xanthoceras sorbifolium]